MGLDMYLYLRKYESVTSWDEEGIKKKEGFYPPELEELADRIYERNFMSRTTEYQVAYWRKANAVHRYFIENCAEGEDDCKPVWVPLEALKALVKICRDIISDPDKAEEELPTQAGFFFGDTKYDEYYFQDLEMTIENLEPIIKFLEKDKNHLKYDIIYQASW